MLAAHLLGAHGRRVRTAPAIAAVAALLLALTAVTVRRNAYWRDELTLWSAVVARLPDAPTAQMNLGLALAGAGRPTEAEAAYRRALALDPPEVTRQRTFINLGLVLLDRGELDEAERLFVAANEIGGHAIAYRGLAVAARKRGQAARRAGDVPTANKQLGRALANVRRALEINPRYPQAHLTLAGAFYDAQQYRAAIEAYRKVVALAPDTDAGRQAAAAIEDLEAWLAAHPERR
jgi:tetratricopeptide (TPR) repeat protein